MSNSNVERWWCCLNPLERGAFQIVQAQWEPVLPFIFKVLFDGYWTLGGGLSNSLRKESFIRSYNLTLGTITPEGAPEVEVYYMDRLYWKEIYDYVTENGSGCARQCRILRFPE